jgi:hypothetical protein
MSNTARIRLLGAVSAVALAAGLGLVSGPAVAAAAPPLTNLAHLNSLLDQTTPAAVAGHTTYKIDSEPSITVPWVYANAQGDGTFTRVGGGNLDAATGHWGQGSFDADDVSRAAVVYVRDWKQTHSAAAKQKAYELLRSTAYFQTTTGPDAGNVVLWMQPDGSLNPSPTPVELPNPSDSGASYWLARSLWAFGEGYAAFKDTDPRFASFLQQRIQLGVSALNREVLNSYGTYKVADGVRVPAWLIVDGADASAEALLGLSAYTGANPSDAAPRTAAKQLARGIALMSSGSSQTWPYGAILPWAQSRSMYHSWASQMPAALANASTTLHDKSLLAPAVTDSVNFTATQLAAGGPDNAWYPTAIDTTQIAYGADSRLQSLLAVAKASHGAGIQQLAGIEAAWYFGMNSSGKPTYDPATGVTFDGIQADGTVNRNSGAESTIHGLLSMLALDANPDVAKLAQSAAHVASRTGLTVAEAETASATTGTVVTPDSAWTGESQYSGGKYLSLSAGQTATIPLATASGAVSVQPVIFEPSGSTVKSTWSAGNQSLGTLTSSVGAQGITAVPGALLPQTLGGSTSARSVTVKVTQGTLVLDAVITRPLVERLTLTGTHATTQLAHSTSTKAETATMGAAKVSSTVRVYDANGLLVQTTQAKGVALVHLPVGGFAVATW